MPWMFPNLPEILADTIVQWNLQPYSERVEKQSKNQKVPEIEKQMLEFVTRGLGQNDHFVLPDLGDMNFPEMLILSVDLKKFRYNKMDILYKRWFYKL